MADLNQYSHVDLLFPSRYVKAADLRGQTAVVWIEAIDPRAKLTMAGGKTDHKPVVRLRGKEKEWILNKTNALAIAKVHGPNVSEWLGKPVAIMPALVEARGEKVEAIRVDVDATRAAAAKHQAPAQQPAPKEDF